MPTAFSLHTTRLLLRPFERADLPAFVAYRSDPEVARYQSWLAPYSNEQAEAFLAAICHMDPDITDGWYQVAVELKATGELIGDLAFCVSGDSAEIGFTLAQEHQRKGYAWEAVTRLLEYLWTVRGIRTLRANCDAENTRSTRLLERLGMVLEKPDERAWFKGRWGMDRWYVLHSLHPPGGHVGPGPGDPE